MSKHRWDDFYEAIEDTRFAKLAKGAKEHAETAWIGIKARADKAWGKTESAALRIKRGWDRRDAWMFGPALMGRMADICAYLSHASYEKAGHPGDEYMSMLTECEGVFRSFDRLRDSDIMLMGPSAHVSSTLTYHTHEKRMDEVMESRFMPAWEWFASTLLDPDRYVSPDDPHEGKAAFLAKRIKNHISYEDVRDLPSTETKRISDTIERLAATVNGAPSGYFEEHALPGKDAQWKDGRPFLLGIHASRGEAWRDELWEKTSYGVVRSRTREEIGVDWCAYVEDMLDVGRVLSLYSSWVSASIPKNEYYEPMAADPNATYMSSKDGLAFLHPEYYEEVEKNISDRFHETWTWLGSVICMLMD